MNEIQMKIAELKIEYAEQKLTDETDVDPRGYGYADEESLFDKLIDNMERYRVDFNKVFIVRVLSKGQRKRFFERMAVVMAYDMNGMEEREFILNTKLLIYAI